MISITQRNPSCATIKLTLFTVSEDEWNTKEDTGKSLKDALHILRHIKRHLSGWSNVEQWKNQAHSWSHYQVTQAQTSFQIDQKCFKKLSQNFKKYLPACLPAADFLVLPNQYCCLGKFFGWFYFEGHAYFVIISAINHCCGYDMKLFYKYILAFRYVFI